MNYIMSSLPDMPLTLSTNDFGTKKYVDGLVRFIEHSAAPITIALKGEWGSGKTSLMNTLYNELCTKEKGFIGIKINTWEYSMLATPEETVVKILVQLVKSLSGADPGTTEKLINFTKNAINFVWRGFREWSKGVHPAAGIAIETINVPNEVFGPDDGPSPISLSDLRDSLAMAIAKSLGGTKRGIIVFVDDLDRLNPPLAVQILELLKNIFTLDNCIFVLAIDFEVVVKGLEPKFGPYGPENEREFRSFFDKIIQVPFSLPVSHYRPMTFVFGALESIGYITKAEKNIPIVYESIERIVVSSVGKNPRAIKRLINTLSLLNCISKCSGDSFAESLDYKILNFAIVAIQVCYPKIYEMLLKNPNFEKWDASIAAKLNIHYPSSELHNGEELNGEIILAALGEKEIFYEQHHQEILTLISIINENAKRINEENPGEAIQDVLFNASVTNVSAAADPVKFDRKDVIYKLHGNVWTYLSSKVPDIRGRFKNNTGNGGMYIELPESDKFEVVFQPYEAPGKIALKIRLDVRNKRPERLKDSPYSEVIADEAVLNVIEPLNEVVKRFSQYGVIEGKTFDGKYIFSNLIDEYKFREGELWEAYSGAVEYWINVKSAIELEDPTIVKVIGDLIIGAYEMNIRAMNLK